MHTKHAELKAQHKLRVEETCRVESMETHRARVHALVPLHHAVAEGLQIVQQDPTC
jgi:hypothetical protein